MKAEHVIENEAGVGKHLNGIDPEKVDWSSKDESYWKRVLTPFQYEVARNHGTERAGTGRYSYTKEKGMYYCSPCGTKPNQVLHRRNSANRFRNQTWYLM